MGQANKIPKPRVNQEFSSLDDRMDPRLNHSPRIAGSPAGRTARELPEEVAGDQQTAPTKVLGWKQPAEELTERSQARTSHTTAEIAETAARIYKAQAHLKDAYNESRRSVEDVLRHVERRGRYLVDKYPLRLIAAAAGAGFVLGVLLRIWRSNRYESDWLFENSRARPGFGRG